MSILKRLFGTRHSTAHSAQPNRTRKAGSGASGKRVRSMKSAAMSIREADHKFDIGPWFIGKTVGGIFEIRGMLGRGGMGIVYRAYDNATMREVAVKVPLGKFVDDEDAKKLFTREAEAWTDLIYPHIVHAFDVRDDQTTDYRPAVFMDYCEGGSLADRLDQNGPLPLPEALDIAIQVCWAVQFAHDKGHIHRDLKPGNILLDGDGRAMVSDFGLVKILEAEEFEAEHGEGGEEPGVRASMREVGGTPEYMPPEQWRGRAVKRSDIYAFGVMLYELFCGALPFTADNPADLRKAHETVPPPNTKKWKGDVPDELAELMQSCLAKKTSDRPKCFDKATTLLSKAYREVTGNAYTTHRQKPKATEISREDKETRAWALVRLGTGCQLRGDLADTDRHNNKALNLFEDLGDRAGMGACYTHMGLVARARGDYDRAMELHAKSLAICEKQGDWAGIGKCYNNMGLVARARGAYDRAMELHEKSLAICEELGDRAGIGKCYNNMGMAAQNRGDYDGAMELYEKDLAIFKEQGDRAGMGVCYGNMGAVADERGAYDRAMELYEKSLALCEELGYKAGKGTCYTNMGVVAKNRGDYDGAMELYEKSLSIREELGDRAGIGECYTNMGVVARACGDYDRAMQLYGQALAICEELGDRADMGKCYMNMGNVAYERGNCERAMELYEKYLAICEELGDRAGMGACYGNMGVAAQNRGDYDGAMELYEKDLAICEELGDKPGMGACYGNMGAVAGIRGGYDRAMELFEKSLSIREELGDKAGMGRCYANIAVNAQRRGNQARMREYARKAVRLLDEIGTPVPPALRKVAGL